MPAAIPDLVSAERVNDSTLNCVVRPGFTFLRGTLRLTITLAELQPPHQATMNVKAKGIGAELQVVGKLQITPTDGGSRLGWSAQVVALKGLVATISRPLIAAAAEKTIENVWQRIRAQLAG